MLVTGVQSHAALVQQPFGRVGVVGPALEQHGPDKRAPLGAAHVLPGYGRAGMQQHAAVQAGDVVARHTHAFQHGRSGQITGEGRLIGLLHGGVGGQPGQLPGQVGVALRRGPPVADRNRHVQRGQGIGKTFQTHVEHVEGTRQKIAQGGAHDGPPTAWGRAAAWRRINRASMTA